MLELLGDVEQWQDWLRTVADREPHESLVLLQVFMAIVAGTGLVLAAVAFLCISCSGDSALQDKPRAAPAATPPSKRCS